ncbi:MAG: hypothetical protein ACE5J3_11130, partial [Methanosarcinales archaeon]
PLIPSNKRQYGLTWSPDGSKIAFVSYNEAGKLKIFLANSDGSNIAEFMPEDKTTKWSPTWNHYIYRKLYI